MKKQGNIVPIVIGVAVVIAAGFYFIVRSNKKKTDELKDKLGDGKKTSSESNSDSPSPSGSTSTSTPRTTVPAGLIPNYSFTFPIKYGDGMGSASAGKRDNVKQLQYRIIQFDNRMLVPFGADGQFGNLTKSALKKIIGKDKITSQSDIDLLQKKTEEKAKGLIQGIGQNFLLGIR